MYRLKVTPNKISALHRNENKMYTFVYKKLLVQITLNMEFHKHVKQKKLDTKGYILHGSICITFKRRQN